MGVPRICSVSNDWKTRTTCSMNTMTIAGIMSGSVTLIIVFGFYVVTPVLLIFINSFNLSQVGQPEEWSLDNWRLAFSQPDIALALRNTLIVFGFYTGLSFPLAVLIAWAIARTKLRWSYGLEFMFWVSFMVPVISVTIGWTYLMDPDVGMLNRLVEYLPFVDEGPFNIFSVHSSG